MEEEKLKRFVLAAVALVFIAAIGIIAVTFYVISRGNNFVNPQDGIIYLEDEIPVSEPGEARQAVIKPNPGGDVPTAIPTKTPEPLQGMDSPLACKLVLAGIHTKARAVNASGIAVLNSYDPGKNTCILDIRNDKAPGDLGRMEIFLNETGEYGITVRIDEAKEDAVRQWSEAALLYFSKTITAEEAEAAIRQALTDGSVDFPLYHISVKNDVTFEENKVMSVRVVQIQSAAAAPENR